MAVKKFANGHREPISIYEYILPMPYSLMVFIDVKLDRLFLCIPKHTGMLSVFVHLWNTYNFNV